MVCVALNEKCMRRLSRRHFNFLFNFSVVAILLIIGWVIPSDLLIKIQVEVALLALSLMIMYELQDKTAGKFTSLQWCSGLVVGILLVGLSLRLEPVWVRSAKLFLQGQFVEASAQLNSRPHANLILFIGLATIFVALTGLLRRALLRYLGYLGDESKSEE